MQYLRISFETQTDSNVITRRDRHPYENSLKMTKTKDNLEVDRIKGFKRKTVLKLIIARKAPNILDVRAIQCN